MRQVFVVVAGGNAEADRHFEDTIQRKRTLNEVRKFLSPQEIHDLEAIYHTAPFVVWGAIPGKMNEPRWKSMQPGDLVLIYNKGCIKLVGEVATKVRSKELARYFWKETAEKETWELIYFIVNEHKVNIPMPVLNEKLGYSASYFPRGFSSIDTEKIQSFVNHYGDLFEALKTLSKGEKLMEVFPAVIEKNKQIEEKIEESSSEHDEMQWRLIRLGRLSRCDVWIPKSDQGHIYSGNKFRDFVLPEIHESLDVPPSIKNIDVVWKFGPYSIKSAFEIEHSTSVYSGILRLSDLRAETPNSQYPLLIVAAEERKRKVFSELSRPTFSGPSLRLNEVIRFLSYEKLRDIDEKYKEEPEFEPQLLFTAGEPVPDHIGDKPYYDQ